MGNNTDATIELVQWLQAAVQGSIHFGSGLERLEHFEAAAHGGPHKIPPERLAFLRKLVKALLNGRVITSKYNFVMAGLVTVFTALHLLEKRRCRRRWRRNTLKAGRAHVNYGTSNTGNSCHGSSSAASSAGSSPRIITMTPSGAYKDSEIDIERLSLLSYRRRSDLPSTSVVARMTSRLAAWLEYQPRPLPLVNRVLPSNDVSCFVILWLCINLFFQFYQLPLGLDYTKVLSSRAGDIFIVNLPLLYLLAAKNQPIKLLTGRSYEAFNILHRRVGEWMCLEAFVHSAGEVLWRFAFAPDWLSIQPNLRKYLAHPIIYFGIGAFISYELLYFTSLSSFRQRWYELFLASHVVLQLCALGFLYMHYYTARPYIKASLAVFLVDRLVWRLRMKSAVLEADLSVLSDGETVRLSAEWEKATETSRWNLWPWHNIKGGWKPTDHVFLSVRALGRSHALQAHPFTISSAAPQRETMDRVGELTQSAEPSDMKLSLLIRAQNGFTADLLRYALHHHKALVRLDGPYGSTHALEMLLAADNAVLIAGGSGVAVTLPLAWALLRDKRWRRGRPRVVRLFWVVHCDKHRHWVPEHELDELVAAGLELVIPGPTSEAGRPDIVGQVEEWIGEDRAQDHAELQTAVVVSGPDGLNRIVRNTCAAAIGRGSDVRLAVEKFGW